MWEFRGWFGLRNVTVDESLPLPQAPSYQDRRDSPQIVSIMNEKGALTIQVSTLTLFALSSLLDPISITSHTYSSQPF